MTKHLAEADQTQRMHALDPVTSFIVQAPAGSGKTELLIQRLLVLLARVNVPEEILAITFTKKAANEMRERVINALKEASSSPEPETPHKRQTWQLAKRVLEQDAIHQWHLLTNPNQLRIQTIDALCAFLTRQLPLLSHFGSQPDIADMPNYLYQEAAYDVLLHIEEDTDWSETIAKLLLHLDNDLNKLGELIVALLAKRDQWLPLIHHQLDEYELKERLEHHLANVIGDCLRSLSSVFPDDYSDELAAIARFTADNLAIDANTNALLTCRNLYSLPGTQASDKQAWQGLAHLLLTKDFTWRKKTSADIGFPAQKNLSNAQEKALHQDYRNRFTTLIEAISDREDLRAAFEQLSTLPDAEINENQFEMLNHLIQVLKIAAAQLRVTFQKYGQIDFIENALAALAALGDQDSPTDLALALDYKIQHILIDEFQDTSSTQYHLLQKLTQGWEPRDGRTLFVVGDPMQSIYRFREAEVGLFLRMMNNGIGSIQLTPITLSVNFRSTTTIVEWNNHHFEKIFPDYVDIATGAVNYSHSISSNHSDISQSIIEMTGFENKNNDDQANHIINTINELKSNYPNDNVAILVRARTHLKQIINKLKAAGIAYHAVDIDPLVSRQTIQDLLALTRALLHPADKIAWLSILRAPWCGLTLADLMIIADKAQPTIWEQLTNRDVLQKISVDGQTRLRRILPILTTVIAERERTDLRHYIENTWLLLGGPACLHNTSDLDDAKTYFELLDEFAQHYQQANLDQLIDKIERSYANAQASPDAIQIMTIHSAKGLEFDSVILPHLERKMPSDDKSLLAWMEQPLTDGDMALLLAPIHATGDDKQLLYEYINKQKKIKNHFETDRLLYVAATRAKKRLYLCYGVDQHQPDTSIDSGSFLKKLWPLIHKQSILGASDITQYSKNITQTERFITRLSSNWTNPIQSQPIQAASLHQTHGGFRARQDDSRKLGIVIHKLLQNICEYSLDWWTKRNLTEQQRLIHKLAKRFSINLSAIDTATNTILNAINNTLTDTRGQWILKQHTDAHSEYAISAIINKQAENLVIDRTFKDDQGIRWIIDYKTSSPDGDNINAFIEKEKSIYSAQLAKYAEAMLLIDPAPIKLGLYFPLIPAWIEWE